MKKLFFVSAAIIMMAGCGTAKKAAVLPEYDFPALNQGGKTAIVAHRGFWKSEEGGMSENSIASLSAAINNGFWGSECDIYLTSDDDIIINHDNRIDGLKIVSHTYDELSSHLLPNGEKRPSLDGYLARASKCAGNTVLVVEFKGLGDEEREDLMVARTFDALKAHGMFDPSKVAFISFGYNICKTVARLAPGFVNQYLNGDIAPDKLAAEGINGIDYEQGVFHLHPEWVELAHRLGMSVNVWTVNNPREIDYMIGLGVDAITTNVPLLVREHLGRKEFRK